MPQISIIVPVYNVEPYIHKCIDSILTQTFTDFELILVDDGSPDNCGQICDEYAKKDNRITVIHKENGGLSSARNAGLDIACGEYITFVDSDDWINLNMLQILYDMITQYDADIAQCQYENMYDERHSQEYPSLPNEIFYYNIFSNNISSIYDTFNISACTKLYKKEIYKNIRFYEGILYEDKHIKPYILYKCDTFVSTNLKLYYYRQSPSSIIRSGYNFKKVESEQIIWHDHLKLFKEKKECILYDKTTNFLCDSYIFDDLFIRLYKKELYPQWKPFHKKIKFFLIKEIFSHRICNMKKLILFSMLISPKLALKITNKYFPNLTFIL